MHIVIIAHNIRSCHNVGAIFRTAEGFGIEKIWLSGYSPYPSLGTADTRLPYIVARAQRDIAKTALGAETLVPFDYATDVSMLLHTLRSDGYHLVGLEQTASSESLFVYQPPTKVVLLLGEEVRGISAELLSLLDETVEIPMYEHKESFNVSVAAGMAMFRLRQSHFD